MGMPIIDPATLDNRLHAVWERSEVLTLSIYITNDSWIDRRPSTAPHAIRKMAEGFLELACELDAIARDVEAEDKRLAASQTALSKSFADAMGMIERDQLTQRLGEITRTGTPRKNQV
jgi:hypothetical protein